MIVKLLSIMKKKSIRPKGYIADVLKNATIVGDCVDIPEEEYHALCTKYDSPVAYCPYRTTKTVNKDCCGNIDILYCMNHNEFTSYSKCRECGSKEKS